MSNSNTSTDINEQVKILTEKLRKTELAYQMACQMSQFKGGFLARIAHELRSPLNGLIGAHQLILSDLCEDPAEEREFIAKAQASAQKLVQLLDEIIGISKAEHGSIELDIKPVSLTDIFNKVYQLTHLQAANRNCHLEIISPNPDIYVLAEPKRLQQILFSLIDAAIIAGRDDKISLLVAPNNTNDTVKIWIDDRSSISPWSEPVDLLISPPALDDPFDENPQLSPGMIMLMAQNLLEMMEGHLELIAVEDNGTKFTRIQSQLKLVLPE